MPSAWLDPLKKFLCEPLEIFAVLDAVFPGRTLARHRRKATSDVGGIPQFSRKFSCAQMAKGQAFIARGEAIRKFGQRLAVDRLRSTMTSASSEMAKEKSGGSFQA